MARSSAIRNVTFTLVLLVVLAAAGRANTVTYTNKTSFDAATSTSLINFSGITSTGGRIVYLGAPLAISGVTFQSPLQVMYLDDGAFVCCTIPGAAATLFNATPFGQSGVAFTVTMPANITAVAFLVDNGSSSAFRSFNVNGGDITVTLNGESFTFGGGSGDTPVFFGVTTNTAITALTISSHNNPSGFNEVELANFQFGAAIPEPSTLILLGSGGLALAGKWRKSRACFKNRFGLRSGTYV